MLHVDFKHPVRNSRLSDPSDPLSKPVPPLKPMKAVANVSKVKDGASSITEVMWAADHLLVVPLNHKVRDDFTSCIHRLQQLRVFICIIKM